MRRKKKFPECIHYFGREIFLLFYQLINFFVVFLLFLFIFKYEPYYIFKMPKKIVPTNQKGIKDFFLIRMNPTKIWLQFIAFI